MIVLLLVGVIGKFNPNQYVEDSKPMGEEERKIAFLKGTPIAPCAEFATLGYPYLILWPGSLPPRRCRLMT